MRVVVDLFGGEPWVLAIDWTNWDFGKPKIHILMISVTCKSIGIPPLWMHQSTLETPTRLIAQSFWIGLARRFRI